MNNRLLLTATFAVLAGGACSTSTPIGVVDTAGTSGGQPTGAAGTTGVAGIVGGTAGTAGATGPYVPSGSQVVDDHPFTNPSGISGDWVGYLENYDLYFTGSDALKLHFGVDAQGHGTLSVVRGTGTPPAPPTDAFQSWPAAIVNDDGSPGVGEDYPGEPVDGFAYTAHAVTWEGSRLKFVLFYAEPWNAWCNLQTSYATPSDPTAFSCDPTFAAVKYTSPGQCAFVSYPARCTPSHLHLCSGEGVCGCNATGCGASTSAGDSYDITFSSDHANGSATGYNLLLMPAAP
jgi:hypothetical protein